MTYIPLHHKYRPQTFSELVGQEAIATTLSNALKQNRIAPAYLFTGARGTGKTSSARIFAKSLNCISVNAPTDKPCGICQTCQEITKGSALDIIEIDAASNTGVDHIRELIERSQFAPVQCRYKVYVIDECVTGDTLIQTEKGLYRVDDSTLVGKHVLSYNDKTGVWEYKKVLRWFDQGVRQVFLIKTKGSTIKCTGNHLIRTKSGWIAAKDLTVGMEILSPADVGAGNLCPNIELTENQEDSLLDIKPREKFPTTRKPIALKSCLNNRFHFAPTVNAGVESNWQSLIPSFDAEEQGWEVFYRTGKITHTNPSTFGATKLRNDFPLLPPFLKTFSVSSTALSWVTVVSPTKKEAASLSLCGVTAVKHNNRGLATSARNLPSCSLTVIRLSNDRDTELEKLELPVEQPETLNLGRFTMWSDQLEKERLQPWTGYNKLHQRDWHGGTWTMVHSTLNHQEAPASNFIRKDSPTRKISCLQIGSQDLDISRKRGLTKGSLQEKHITTSTWEQIHQGNGYQSFNSTQFPQWHTNLEQVESIELGGFEPVYDIEVEDNHNFVGNGLTLHNCHMLTSASFNALLKTLEEPPEQVVFILATTDPQRVLPTIISRCQRFDFRRIPIDSMTQHLKTIAQKEQISIADDALYLIAQISQGGLRDAESLLDQLSLLAGKITVERVWDLVGAVPERDLMTLIEAIAQNNPESVLDTTRRLMDRGREPLIVLQNLASFYRDLLIAKTAPDRGDLVALTAPTWAQLCEFAKTISIESILSGQQRLKESEIQLKNTTQPRLWLEVTLMGLLPSSITPDITPSIPVPVKPAVSQPIAKPVEAVISQPIPESIPEPVEEPAANESTDLDRLWQTIINNLQPFGTQALLKQHGSLVSFDGDTAKIGIPEKLLPMAQSRSKSIVAALTRTFEKEVKLSLIAPTATVAVPTAEPKLETPPTEPAEPTTPTVDTSATEPEAPPQEFSPPADWYDDEVTRAARTLAEAFNGELVDVEDSTIEPLETTDQALSSDAAPLEEPEEEEDDDTPF